MPKFIVTFSLAAALCGCETMRPAIEPNNILVLTATELKRPLSPAAGRTPLDSIERLNWHRANAVYCADEALEKGDALPDACRGKISVFLESAITASDEACEKWFDWLLRSDIETTYAKNWLNIAGNSAQAIMGLTGDSPTQIAKVALALGFGNSGFDNYRSVFLMTSTLGKVRKKIQQGRVTAADAIRANVESYISWDDANEDAKSYHRTCSRQAVMEIVEAGVDATAYKLVNFDMGEPGFNAANQQLFRAIFQTDGQFSAGELKSLVDNLKDIIKPMPALTSEPLKSAQDRYSKLSASEQSAFQLWIETVGKYLKKLELETDRAAKKAKDESAIADAKQKAVNALQKKTNTATAATEKGAEATEAKRNATTVAELKLADLAKQIKEIDAAKPNPDNDAGKAAASEKRKRLIAEMENERIALRQQLRDIDVTHERAQVAADSAANDAETALTRYKVAADNPPPTAKRKPPKKTTILLQAMPEAAKAGK